QSFCSAFHSIGLAAIECGVGINPRVRKEYRVNRVVALPVVTCERAPYSAGNLLARANLELVLTNRLEGRQRYREILEKTGQPGARDENILNRRRHEKVIVRCVEHRARTGKSVREIDARTEVGIGRGKTVAVKSQAGVHCQPPGQLHRVLHIGTALASGPVIPKCNRPAIGPSQVDSRQAKQMRKSDVAFSKKEKIFIRPQDRQVYSAFERVRADEPREITFETER